MKILKITASNRSKYENTELSFDGSIEIDESLGCLLFKSLKAVGYILAKSGSGIEAGGGIKAGWDIKAGGDIKAGLSITAKTIFLKLRVFAGLAIWKIPTPEESMINAKLLSGTVAFGTLNEPKEAPKTPSCEGTVVEVGGKKYRLVGI